MPLHGLLFHTLVIRICIPLLHFEKQFLSSNHYIYTISTVKNGKKNGRKKSLLVKKCGRNIAFHMLSTTLENALQETFTTDLDRLMNSTSGLLGTKI